MSLIIALQTLSVARAEPAARLTPPCADTVCLAVTPEAEIFDRLQTLQGVDADDLAKALQYVLHSDAPLRVRLVAIRYENRRLVRYAVSTRMTLDPATSVDRLEPDAETLQRAFRPVTEHEVRLRIADPDRDVVVPIARESFVGHLPPTWLVGADRTDLLDEAARDLQEQLNGSIGVLVLLPDVADRDLSERIQTFALLLDLQTGSR